MENKPFSRRNFIQQSGKAGVSIGLAATGIAIANIVQ